MGAGGWVTGGVRRAVANVVGAMPGGLAVQDPDEVRDALDPMDADTDEAPLRASAPTKPAPKSAAPKTAAPGASARKSAAQKTPAPKAAAPKSAAPKSAAPKSADGETQAKPAARAPRPAATAPTAAEAPAAPPTPVWTDEELASFRAALDADLAQLRDELAMGEADLAGLIADSADGAGDDQADAGSKTFEREHEMSVNANTREMLDQALRAHRRLDAGTYGICESCAKPIAIGRLRAFPRATLCISCKQAEERR